MEPLSYMIQIKSRLLVGMRARTQLLILKAPILDITTRLKHKVHLSGKHIQLWELQMEASMLED